MSPIILLPKSDSHPCISLHPLFQHLLPKLGQLPGHSCHLGFVLPFSYPYCSQRDPSIKAICFKTHSGSPLPFKYSTVSLRWVAKPSTMGPHFTPSPDIVPHNLCSNSFQSYECAILLSVPSLTHVVASDKSFSPHSPRSLNSYSPFRNQLKRLSPLPAEPPLTPEFGFTALFPVHI